MSLEEAKQKIIELSAQIKALEQQRSELRKQYSIQCIYCKHFVSRYRSCNIDNCEVWRNPIGFEPKESN